MRKRKYLIGLAAGVALSVAVAGVAQAALHLQASRWS